MKNVTLVTLVLAASGAGVFGCKQAEHARPHAQAARRALAHATQADLAHDLDSADRDGTWEAVRTKWRGQHVTWTVTRHPALCAAPDACHVAAFPVERPARRGWLPGLELDPQEFAKLAAACGKADSCEVELEGTVHELVVSPEQPTSLSLGEVHVLRAHPT